MVRWSFVAFRLLFTTSRVLASSVYRRISAPVKAGLGVVALRSISLRSGEDIAMVDDKSKAKEDRKLVASGETYEVAAFAKKYGIPPSEAGVIIKRYGPSRKKLDAHMASRNA
jgi:hypothetical protein